MRQQKQAQGTPANMKDYYVRVVLFRDDYWHFNYYHVLCEL